MYIPLSILEIYINEENPFYYNGVNENGPTVKEDQYRHIQMILKKNHHSAQTMLSKDSKSIVVACVKFFTLHLQKIVLSRALLHTSKRF